MNRYTTPVLFSFAKNLTFVYGKVTFNPSGVPVLDTNNSQGICSFNIAAVSFTGNTSSGSNVITSVSSFAGLFNGMSLTGSGGYTATISSITAAAGTMVVTGGNGVAQGANPLQATGGRYVIQFGQQAGVRLDAYNKLLAFKQSFDQTLSSVSGTTTTNALAPLAPNVFIVGNNTSVITVPKTTTSGSTDATLTIQMGTGQGGSFTAVTPSEGDTMRFEVAFKNSTAI